MLSFNSSTGFEVSETADIRESVAQDWKDAFAEDDKPELITDPETPAGQMVDSQTAAIAQKDAELAFLAQQFNPLTASGIWQDALAKIYFLTRKPAINSSAVCMLTGLQGTTIPAGAQIQSSEDQTIWTLSEAVTIPAAGTVSGTFICESAGTISAPADTLTKIITTVPGWDSVTNPAAATVGQLEETQAAFEARRYASVALNSRSADASVYARVAACDGVISVFVRSNRTSSAVTIDNYSLAPHSIYCAVTGGDDDDIARAIYESLSAGCDYNGNTTINVTDSNTGAIEPVSFERPAVFNVYLRVMLQDGVQLPNDYENIIKNALIANFYGESELAINGQIPLRIKMFDDVYASRFLPSVLNAGIDGLLGIEISSDGTNWENMLHIPINGNPELDEANITIDLI